MTDGRKGIISHVRKESVSDEGEHVEDELDKLGVAGIRYLTGDATNERELRCTSTMDVLRLETIGKMSNTVVDGLRVKDGGLGQ